MYNLAIENPPVNKKNTFNLQQNFYEKICKVRIGEENWRAYVYI